MPTQVKEVSDASILGLTASLTPANVHLVSCAQDLYAALKSAPVVGDYYDASNGWDYAAFVHVYQKWRQHVQELLVNADGQLPK